jgi:uncharacterized protein (DUF2252 family)
MAESPFRFYRGAAAVMAWDLARTPATGVKVQACGDAHVLNFGGYASPERRLVFDVNDFDETLPAPWEYDLKRLVASVVLDGRANGFSEDQAADAVRDSVDRYRRVTQALAEMTSLDIHFAHIESRRFLAEVDDPAMAKATRKYVRKARGGRARPPRSPLVGFYSPPELLGHRSGSPTIGSLRYFRFVKPFCCRRQKNWSNRS